MTVWSRLRHRMSCHPNATVSDGERTRTYEAWITEIETLSKSLTPHTGAAILCRSAMSTATAVLACFAAGVTALPLPADPIAITRDRMRLAQLSAILTEENGVFTVRPYKALPSARPSSAEAPSLILFTAGTTDTPKGVCLSEANLMAALSDCHEVLPFTESDRLLLTGSLTDADSLISLLLPALTCGVSLFFASASLHPTKLLSLLERQAITAFFATPTRWATLLRFVSRALPLRTLFIGGEYLGQPLAEAIVAACPKARLLVGYGATETGGWIAFSEPFGAGAFSPALHPLPSVQLARSNGSLVVSGNRVMLGYLTDGAKFPTPTPFWNSGDLSELAEDGTLRLAGRAAERRYHGAIPFDPVTVEGALSGDPRVWEVRYDPGSRPDGAGAVLQVAGRFVHPDEIRQLCRQRLPAAILPKQIEIVASLPQTPNGKRLRRGRAT